MDERSFHLPYHKVPQSHYNSWELPTMRQRRRVQKLHGDFASPLVFVKRKGGSFCCMHICTDFRWPGAEGHSLIVPLGRCTFSPERVCLLFHMDLPSEFYNVPLHKTQKKYVAYFPPFTLHEYNTMPHSVEEPCNLCAHDVIFRMKWWKATCSVISTISCFFYPSEHQPLEHGEAFSPPSEA